MVLEGKKKTNEKVMIQSGHILKKQNFNIT